MRIRDLTIDPPIVLAPMSGITDIAFRTLCREMGAALAYTGLISANALRYRSAKTRTLLDFPPHDHPIAVQVFGADPDVVAAAADIAVGAGADMVDINMGCSVPKVLRANAGAALMADLERAVAMVKAVVSAVAGTPVGVKLRSGRRGSYPDAVEFAKRFEDVGLSFIAVHPRWIGQGFRDTADWAMIARVREAVSMPVIGNGDVHHADDAVRMRAETGCDAVMIGRPCLGNPWVFAQMAAGMRGDPAPTAPSLEERIAMAGKHLSLIIDDRGEDVGVREMRKHVAWYLKGIPDAAAFRERANRAKSLLELQATLEGARRGLVVQSPEVVA
jgi:nifR3 family TIM-barrel protein